MSDKYVVEYNAVNDIWNIDTLSCSLKSNVKMYFDDVKSTYMILFIANTYEEALEAMNFLKDSKTDMELRKELHKKIIQFPSQNLDKPK